MSFLFCCFRKPKQLPYKPKVEKKFRPVTISILPKKNRKRTKKLKQMMFYNDYVIRRITDNNNNDNQPQSQSLSLESNIDDEDADDEKIEEKLSSISINQQEEETIADVNDDDITEDIEQSIQSIQSTLLLTSLPTIYEHPMEEDDYYDDDIENNNSPFQMEPIRLHFTDESSSSQTSSSYNSNNGGVCCIDNNNIFKQQINKSSSICNLDHLFGSETISFQLNNSGKKSTIINRPSRLVIRRNDDGSLIDEIVDAVVDDKSFVDRGSIADSGKPTGSGHESSPFQMKLERGRGSRHRYQIDRCEEFGSNEWKTTLEQIFRSPKKGLQFFFLQNFFRFLN